MNFPNNSYERTMVSLTMNLLSSINLLMSRSLRQVSTMNTCLLKRTENVDVTSNNVSLSCFSVNATCILCRQTDSTLSTARAAIPATPERLGLVLQGVEPQILFERRYEVVSGVCPRSVCRHTDICLCNSRWESYINTEYK